MTSPVRAAPAHPFRGPDRPLVMAHRGGGGLFPENTLAAFQNAVTMGADVLETDVHLTADGVLVLLHDDVVDRVTDGRGRVDQLSLAQLKALDAGFQWSDGDGYAYRGRGFTIPTLEEVLTAFPAVWVNLDIKPPAGEIVPRLAEALRRWKATERVLVGSFFDHNLRRFRRLCPEVVTSTHHGESWRFLIMSRLGLSRWFRSPAKALQIPDRHRGFQVVTPALIRDAHAGGRAVHVWTINDPQAIARLSDWGADGIVTDFPNLMLK